MMHDQCLHNNYTPRLQTCIVMYGSLERNMEDFFGIEWKEILSMEYGKIIFHSIPYRSCMVASHVAF